MRLGLLPLSFVTSGLLAVAIACGGDDDSRTDSESPAAPDSPAVSTVELVDALRPSVVQIQTEVGAGTGFIIDEDGHIVTNNHVIVNQTGSPARNITATLSGGDEFSAEVVGRDPPTDLAVLRIDATDIEPVPLGDSEATRVGEPVIAMGNALNLPGGPTVTTGVVSAKGRLIQETNVTIPDALQTDAAINPGNSGGPLVNYQGEVVGITTAVALAQGEFANNIGLAISINVAEPLIEELIDIGEIDRGMLGVAIQRVQELYLPCYPVDASTGLLVVNVEAGSPADEAGVQACDVIVGLAGEPVDTSGDLFRLLTENRAGERVQIELRRGSQTVTETITLG